MARHLRVLLHLSVLGGLLLACQGGGSAGPSSPARTPDSTAIEWTRFTSDRYGYAVDHPSDWEALEKVGVSTPSLLRPFGGGTDMFATPDNLRWQTRHGMQVAVFDVEAGTTLKDFTRSIHMPCGGPLEAGERMLDDEPAVYRRFVCQLNRPYYIQVTALHEDRGYVLWLMTVEAPPAHERPEYEAILESFTFTDVAAAAAGD